jgi:hypothetical protein
MQASIENALADFNITLKNKKDEHGAWLKNLHQQSNVPQIPLVTPTKPPWFNVTLDPNFKKPVNPYDTTASLPDHCIRQSPTHAQRHHYTSTHDNYVTPIPTTVQANPNMTSYELGLPPINHDQAIKRVKIQFTGLGDMFVF